MALYRNIQMSFWTDPDLLDNFTPEDKYFYLYIMTNPHTNLAGCYEISLKQISDETGYTKEIVEKLLDRFYSIHRKCAYNKNTHELLITNWAKYNWTTSPKTKNSVLLQIEKVKDRNFKDFLIELFYNDRSYLDKIYRVDTPSVPHTYPTDTVGMVSNTDTNTNADSSSNTDIVSIANIPDSNKAEEIFEKVWKLYPKKAGKGQVSKSQKNRLAHIGEEELTRCVQRFQDQMKREGREYKYWPQGSTFFNSGYVDYLDENYQDTATSIEIESASSARSFFDGKLREAMNG